MNKPSKAELKEQRRAARQEAKEAQPKLAAAAALVKSAHLKTLLNGARVVLIDVGYRGGLQKEWVAACPLLHVVGIEPRGATERDQRDVEAGCEISFVEARSRASPGSVLST